MDSGIVYILTLLPDDSKLFQHRLILNMSKIAYSTHPAQVIDTSPR